MLIVGIVLSAVSYAFLTTAAAESARGSTATVGGLTTLIYGTFGFMASWIGNAVLLVAADRSRASSRVLLFIPATQMCFYTVLAVILVGGLSGPEIAAVSAIAATIPACAAVIWWRRRVYN